MNVIIIIIVTIIGCNATYLLLLFFLHVMQCGQNIRITVSLGKFVHSGDSGTIARALKCVGGKVAGERRIKSCIEKRQGHPARQQQSTLYQKNGSDRGGKRNKRH